MFKANLLFVCYILFQNHFYFQMKTVWPWTNKILNDILQENNSPNHASQKGTGDPHLT